MEPRILQSKHFRLKVKQETRCIIDCKHPCKDITVCIKYTITNLNKLDYNKQVLRKGVIQKEIQGEN